MWIGLTELVDGVRSMLSWVTRLLIAAGMRMWLSPSQPSIEPIHQFLIIWRNKNYLAHLIPAECHNVVVAYPPTRWSGVNVEPQHLQ